MVITCTIGGASAGGAVAVISPATITLRAGSWIRYRNFNWPQSSLTVTATLGAAQGNGQTANISLGRGVSAGVGVANGEGKAAIITLAAGGTVSYSFTNGNSSLEFSQSGALNYFNSGLGTLVGATLRLTLHYSADIIATLSGAPGPYTIHATESCDLYSTSTLSSLDTLFGSGGTAMLSDSVATPNFAIDSGNSPHTFATISSSPFVDVNLNSILGDLVGSGTFSVTGASGSGLGLSGGGGHVNLSNTPLGGFDGMITYTYV